jgi:hypothetical protein
MSSALRIDAQEEFLTLLCADEDLLRAEFEAIVDANWERPKPPRLTPPTSSGPPGCWHPALPPTNPPGLTRCKGGLVWCRERSPPANVAQIKLRKDGDNRILDNNCRMCCPTARQREHDTAGYHSPSPPPYGTLAR